MSSGRDHQADHGAVPPSGARSIGGGSSTAPAYRERLGVPLRWWALGTMFLASLLLAFLVAMPAALAFAVFGVLALATVALFVGYGSATLVVDDHLRAGAARIPIALLARPVALDAEQTRRQLGVEADARAYLLTRPYLKRSVRVDVVDPADPTPYWLLSTRHPRTLAAALARAIDLAGRDGASEGDGDREGGSESAR